MATKQRAFKFASGAVTVRGGRVRVTQGNALTIATDVLAQAKVERWEMAEGTVTWQLVKWAEHKQSCASLFSVASVIEKMVAVGFSVLHVKEYTQNNHRCLLVQASHMLEDDDDIGGQMYVFIFNGHAWLDVSEALDDEYDVKWHWHTEDAIFYSRTEK